MKHIIIPALVVITMLACGNSTPPDHKVTSEPLSVNHISTDSIKINFEDNVIGKIPNGFTQSATGNPQTLDWKIRDDKASKVAAQLANNQGDYYNLLVLNEYAYQDLKMSVRIKAISGNEDQGGGLMWRYVDNNNYYIARCNPLENNFRLYRVVNGNRRQLKSTRSNIKEGEWFTMTILMRGDKISCSINGNEMIETTDDTFAKTGRVGFWTKADAQTYFDDLTIQSIN